MFEYLALLVILLLLSAFFSGTETAFMSLGKFKFKEYVRKKRPHWEKVKVLKEDPHRLISTILIGNNIVNIAAASFGTIIGFEFARRMGWAVSEAVIGGVITGVLTIFVLIFGEVIPKTYAHRYYNQVVGYSVRVIYILSYVFAPIIKILDVITHLVTNGKVNQKLDDRITEEEIKTIINVGSDEGGIDLYERQLIHKIFQFNDKIAKEIMTPSTKVFELDKRAKIHEVLRDVLKRGYSRIPVYDENPDNVIGVFHVWDILEAVNRNKMDKTVGSLSVKPYFVPESKQIDVLFKEMQKRKLQLAMVVDEYGKLAGVITIEDLLEEIVGEIYDEDEQPHAAVRKISATEFSATGGATLREIKEKSKLKLEGLESDTISSLILSKLGYIPKKDEFITVDKAVIKVTKATEKAIESVRIIRKRQ